MPHTGWSEDFLLNSVDHMLKEGIQIGGRFVEKDFRKRLRESVLEFHCCKQTP